MCVSVYINGQKAVKLWELTKLLGFTPLGISSGPLRSHSQQPVTKDGCLCAFAVMIYKIDLDFWVDAFDGNMVVLVSPTEFGWHPLVLDDLREEPELDGVKV